MNKLKPLLAVISVMVGGSMIGYALSAIIGAVTPILLGGIFFILINILNNPPITIASASATLAGGAFVLIGLFPLPVFGIISVWVTTILLQLLVTDQLLKKS